MSMEEMVTIYTVSNAIEAEIIKNAFQTLHKILRFVNDC